MGKTKIKQFQAEREDTIDNDVWPSDSFSDWPKCRKVSEIIN